MDGERQASFCKPRTTSGRRVGRWGCFYVDIVAKNPSGLPIEGVGLLFVGCQELPRGCPHPGLLLAETRHFLSFPFPHVHICPKQCSQMREDRKAFSGSGSDGGLERRMGSNRSPPSQEASHAAAYVLRCSRLICWSMAQSSVSLGSGVGGGGRGQSGSSHTQEAFFFSRQNCQGNWGIENLELGLPIAYIAE